MATLWRHRRILAGWDLSPVTGVVTVGGRITATGDADELRRHHPGIHEVIDLPDSPGSVVIPGLVDAHLHLALYGRAVESVDLRGCRDLSEATDRVRAWATKDIPVITGGGWEWQKWPDNREPGRADLDAVVSDRPAVLESQDRHTCWVNTAFYHTVGLPVGTGILREDEGWQAIKRLGDIVGEVTPLSGAIRSASDLLVARGITAVHSMDGEDARAAVLELAGRGELPLRVVQATRWDSLDRALDAGRRTGASVLGRWVTEGPVKFFADGALGSRTCHMCAPFAGTTESGVCTIDDEEFTSLVARCQAAGLAVAVHAIGDRANQRCLDVFDKTAATRPEGLRHRIEHAQFVRPADVTRFARLQVVASMQPVHAITDMDLVDQVVGDRPLAAYAWRSLMATGAVVAFGSDAPVEDPLPFETLDAAIHRSAFRKHAPGWRTEERVTARAAIRAHTSAGWQAAGADPSTGTLAAGQLADFVVVDRDPLSGDRLYDARALCTVVNGQVRHSL